MVRGLTTACSLGRGGLEVYVLGRNLAHRVNLCIIVLVLRDVLIYEGSIFMPIDEQRNHNRPVQQVGSGFNESRRSGVAYERAHQCEKVVVLVGAAVRNVPQVLVLPIARAHGLPRAEHACLLELVRAVREDARSNHQQHHKRDGEQSLQRLHRVAPAEDEQAGNDPEHHSQQSRDGDGGSLRVGPDARQEHHRLHPLAEHGAERQ
mmetsp:Transcript_29780/g.50013  ORF Transcript_29780/g.50013 Transcript_29780/m.50013 type:complete len:206 (+) Transcript_29780:137-754(+)